MIISAMPQGPAALLEAVVVFPFWLWGPTLLLAAWGYALRQAQGTNTGTPDTNTGTPDTNAGTPDTKEAALSTDPIQEAVDAADAPPASR